MRHALILASHRLMAESFQSRRIRSIVLDLLRIPVLEAWRRQNKSRGRSTSIEDYLLGLSADPLGAAGQRFARLAGRVLQAVGARVVVISSRFLERAVRLVLSAPNDLVNEAVSVLVIQVVNLTPVWIHMGDILLSVHAPLVLARHLVSVNEVFCRDIRQVESYYLPHYGLVNRV